MGFSPALLNSGVEYLQDCWAPAFLIISGHEKKQKTTHAAESVFHMFMEDVVELFCEELFHCTKQCGFQL